MKRDIRSNVDTGQSIAPAAHNATVNGTGIDVSAYDAAMVVFDVGTITDGIHTPTLEESDTLGSGYTTVAAADMVGTFAALASNVQQRVGYVGSKRYIRAVSTVAGATTGGVYGAAIVRGLPHIAPLA